MIQHSHSGELQVQGALQGMGDSAEQLGVIARLGQRHPPEMMGEVEPGMVNPLVPPHLRALWNCLNTFCQKHFELIVVGGGTVYDGDRAERHARMPNWILGLRMPDSRVVSCGMKVPRRSFLNLYQYPLRGVARIGLTS